MTSLIIVDPAANTSRFTADAIEKKEMALATAGIVMRVSNAAENQTAVNAQAMLRTAINDAEKARVAVKAPVIALGKAIDGAAAEYATELKAEELRVAKLVGDFQQLEIAKQKAAEAAQRLEAERAERERQEEVRRIAREEAQRIAEIERKEKEARAKAEKVERELADARREADTAEKRRDADRLNLEAIETRKASAALQLDLDRQREIAQAESHQAMEAAQERADSASAAVPQVAPTRAKGQVVAEDWDIVVTNEHALAHFHPLCVDIKPRISEIKAQLKMGVKIHGVTATPIVKSSVRAGKGLEIVV